MRTTYYANRRGGHCPGHVRDTFLAVPSPFLLRRRRNRKTKKKGTVCGAARQSCCVRSTGVCRPGSTTSSKSESRRGIGAIAARFG
jgi:hypothetical protein